MGEVYLRLGRLGWQAMFASDLNRAWDLATIFMCHKEVPQMKHLYKKQKQMAALSIAEKDLLELINLNQEVALSVHEEMVKAWLNCNTSKDPMEQKTAKDIRQEGTGLIVVNSVGFNSSFEDSISLPPPPPNFASFWKYSITSYPWLTGSVHAALVIVYALRALRAKGYDMVISMNVNPSTDTIYHIKDDTLKEENSPMMALCPSEKDELWVLGPHFDSKEPDKDIVEAVEAAIKDHWPEGASRKFKAGQIPGLGSFKMCGTPWWADGQAAVHTRILVLKIMESLLQAGWLCIDAMDIFNQLADKSLFVFRKCNPVTTNMVAISFNQSDRIRLMNGNPEMQTALEKTIKNQWNIQKSSEYGPSYEWKLEGKPWDEGFFHNKALALFLLHAMTELGWVLICSADISAKSTLKTSHGRSENCPDDIHSWFFMTRKSLIDATK